MYIVQTYLGYNSELYKEFYSIKDAKNYKNHLIKKYDFDPDYIEIHYCEI